MRVLAFDTATALTAVALRDVGEAPNVCLLSTVDLAAVDDPPAGQRPGHAQRLLVLINELLTQDGGWDGVDRIAVGVGPGTFTGLRIGIATAHALARATARPLVGVSTLRSLALAVHDRDPDIAKLAVIDARRNEAFVAGWKPGADPLTTAPALAPCVLRPEELEQVAVAIGGDRLAVGDGALKFRELFERAGARVPGAGSSLHRVSAREHARLAVLEPIPAGLVEPEYLRLPDAEISLKP
jgi:tRNA threonylcarbamoyladenosine biosynthesis protein TsaB